MYCQIIITGKCNFACSYCMQKEKKNVTVKNDDLDKICDFIINLFKRDKNNNVNSVSICGGEPLLHMEIINHIITKLNNEALKNNIKIIYEVSTNASLIDEKIINFFEVNEITPYVGFDGIAASQNLNRKCKVNKDSYEQVFRNLKLIYKRPKLKDKLIINSVITANNVKFLYESFKFLYDNFTESKITLNIAYNSDWNKNGLSVFYNELIKIGKLYYEILQTTNYSINIIDSQIFESLNPSNARDNYCGGGKDSFSITVNGDILPCGNFTSTGIGEEKIKIGNIYDGISEQFINKFKMEIVKVNDPDCQTCLFNSRCRRFCPFTRYMAGSKETEISEKFCEISKMLIMATDKIMEDFYNKNPDLFLKKYKQKNQ